MAQPAAREPGRSRIRFTKPEKSWILYDWANSVYATNMMAAIFPIYYASVAGDAGDKWWGIGVSAASLLIAVMAPVLGAIGDFRGMKKRMLTAFLIIGVAFTALTAFVGSWQWMLIGYVLSHIGYSGANVFYDSFLTDVTEGERMDKVSAWGYAMGYLGGSTIPFVISIVFLLATGFSVTAVKFSILITCVWWAVFSIPLLKNVHQEHYVDTPPRQLVSSAMRNLAGTMKAILHNRGVLVFLLAYFFYIDGVNTVISLATNYGATLGLGSTGMILALLVTQIVAVPCSILFGRLAKRLGSVNIIIGAIAVYFVICSVGFSWDRMWSPISWITPAWWMTLPQAMPSSSPGPTGKQWSRFSPTSGRTARMRWRRTTGRQLFTLRRRTGVCRACWAVYSAVYRTRRTPGTSSAVPSRAKRRCRWSGSCVSRWPLLLPTAANRPTIRMHWPSRRCFSG